MIWTGKLRTRDIFTSLNPYSPQHNEMPSAIARAHNFSSSSHRRPMAKRRLRRCQEIQPIFRIPSKVPLTYEKFNINLLLMLYITESPRDEKKHGAKESRPLFELAMVAVGRDRRKCLLIKFYICATIFRRDNNMRCDMIYFHISAA